TGLYVFVEAVLGDFEQIRADRKIREHVTAVRLAACRAGRAGSGLRHPDRCIRYARSTGVTDAAANLRRLSKQSDGREANTQYDLTNPHSISPFAVVCRSAEKLSPRLAGVKE